MENMQKENYELLNHVYEIHGEMPFDLKGKEYSIYKVEKGEYQVFCTNEDDSHYGISVMFQKEKAEADIYWDNTSDVHFITLRNSKNEEEMDKRLNALLKRMKYLSLYREEK